MYIGSTGERGLHHLVYEVVDNSVDEALAGYCSAIEVTLLADGGVRVVDDGRGIPVDIVESEGKPAVEVVLTVLHAGGKFGGGGYTVSGGLHGVGVSVVNALSGRLEVEVRRDGSVWRQSYVLGVPQAPLARGEDSTDSGTTVTFWPSTDIFETTAFDFETLRTRFQQMAFLNRGLQITLVDERPDHADTEGTAPIASFRYDGGLVDYVTHLNGAKKNDPVNRDVIFFETEDAARALSVEVAMQWTTAYSESVHTYANTINTHEGGTHEEGFRAALTSLVNKYARDKSLLKEKDDNLAGDDIREGLTAVISVKLAEPQFEGQTRQHRGQGVRPARGRRPVGRLVGAQPDRGARRRPQGDPGRRRPVGGAAGSGGHPAQGVVGVRRDAGQVARLPAQRSRAGRGVHRRGRLRGRVGRSRP
jgi:DNA gyrase subunit B